MLGSVQPPVEVKPLAADALLDRWREVKPERRRQEGSRRQVQILLVQHDIREELLPPESHYLFRYFDPAVAGQRLVQSLLAQARHYRQLAGLPWLRVVV